MIPRDWTCPSCGLATDLGPDRVQQTGLTSMNDPEAACSFVMSLIHCPNRLCGQAHVSVARYAVQHDAQGKPLLAGSPTKTWQLQPGPKGRQLPHYVPEGVACEFAQASEIASIAPAAAACLARRCLQALVRDFWDVKKTFLSDELDAIKSRVDPETWEAIEAVRRTGNIGKHLEKGANVVIDVENEEPELLLSLIEYLVEDWYVARRRRQQRLAAIKGRGDAREER